MQAPADFKRPEHRLWDEYLSAVRQALGAEDVHMRILYPGGSAGVRFRLAGAAGFLPRAGEIRDL